jgi:hypothetical protein
MPVQSRPLKSQRGPRSSLLAPPSRCLRLARALCPPPFSLCLVKRAVMIPFFLAPCFQLCSLLNPSALLSCSHACEGGAAEMEPSRVVSRRREREAWGGAAARNARDVALPSPPIGRRGAKVLVRCSGAPRAVPHLLTLHHHPDLFSTQWPLFSWRPLPRSTARSACRCTPRCTPSPAHPRCTPHASRSPIAASRGASRRPRAPAPSEAHCWMARASWSW